MFVVVDPAEGRQRIPAADFSNRFTGILIAFRPNERFRKNKKLRLSPVWGMLHHTLVEASGRRLLGFMLGSSVVLQILGLVSPLAVKIVVDNVVPFKLGNALSLVFVAIVIVVVTRVITALLRSLALLRLRTSLDSRSMAKIVTALLQLPFSFFQIRSIGDLTNRVIGFTNIRQLLTNYGVNAALDAFFIIGYFIGAFFVSVPLAIVLGGFLMLQILSLMLTANLQRRLAKSLYAAQSEQMTYLVGLLSGMEYLKASGSEDCALSRWSTLLHNQLSASNRLAYLSYFLSAVSTLCSVGGPLAVLFFGTDLVLAGRITTGTMLGATVLIGMVFEPLSGLVTFIQQLHTAAAYVERLDDVISAPKESLHSDGCTTGPLHGEIEFRNVHFTYPGSTAAVLQGLSFHILSGEKVALVGPTGSGKSTLAKLMIALDSPTSGEVWFDSLPLCDLKLKELRMQLGFVPQNPILFHTTLRENITVGLPACNLDDVIRACTLACIHEDIARLPLGYETVVAEQGQNFSGGQRQRIAIARALLRRPRILILDEATSHLDSVTEHKIDTMIADLRCTRIVIAHRLSTVANSDRILVLDKGILVESGSHQDLLGRNGRYAAMTRTQASEYSKGSVLGRAEVAAAEVVRRTGRGSDGIQGERQNGFCCPSVMCTNEFR